MANIKAQEEYLRETKALMRSTLASHGVTITDDTPFREYVNGINEAVASAGNSMEEVAALRAKLTAVIDTPRYSDDGLENPVFIEESDLSGVSVIRRYAMYQHAGLVGLSVPGNVTSIDPTAFYGCTNLATVKLPKKIRLQSSCFTGCTSLQKVYLPEVTSIDELPTLVQINAFNSTTCNFVVQTEATKNLYTTDSNWNTYADRFIIEEATA